MAKKTPSLSIDGFVPNHGNAPRLIGFDVAKKPAEVVSKPLRRQADSFPAIGHTLNTYRPTLASSLQSSVGTANPGVIPRPAPSPFNLDIDDEHTSSKGKKPVKTRVRRVFGWKHVLAFFLILLLSVGGWLGFKFIYNAVKTFHGNPLSLLSATRLQGEDVGRVNVLLAGNSSDDPGHDGASLTDSIMVLSLDTKNNTAFMLSVPRDLYVNIPGYGHAKINEAYVDGESGGFSQEGYFPGGMGLLQEVIQTNFNLNLNYYALIDYAALRDMVNAVGGVTVNIKSDDPRGLYDPSVDYVTNGPLVKLSNGTHTLDGEQALDLARARGDAYGSYGFPAADFDRTENQRMMLMALKSKVISANVLANPLTVSKLTDAVGKNITTNMSLSEARRAYDLSKDISNIESIGLNNVNGKNLLASYATSTGQSALIPAAGIDDFSAIQALIAQLTSNDPIVREDAQVVVLNGTDTSGLAGSAAKRLTDKNVNVLTTGDANGTSPKTTIIDASGGAKNATKGLLEELFGKNVTTTNPYKGVYDADFIVVIGNDHASIGRSTSSTD